MMNEKLIKIKELVELLNKANEAYYKYDNPVMTDRQYDDLYDKLVLLEHETGIVMANSPTQNVGYEVKSKLDKIKHSHPMLSLGKTKLVDDLKEFSNNQDCLLSLKMDGLTVLLTYDNGELIQAETRGNGDEGEIITHNARVFDNIPVHINYKERLEIEGEAILTYEAFNKINSKLPEDAKYKNPRNLASGSARQLDSSIAAQRHIQFIVWKVPTEIDCISNSNSFLARLDFAKHLGFTIVPAIDIKKWETNYDEYIDNLKVIAASKGYPIDGLVMTYDDIAYGKSLGATSRHPKHSIAFKFYEDEEETILTKIEWQVGKTGVITPVAYFEPVELCGTTVEKASLHNISIMKKLELGIGDSITVYKANEIIPQIRDNITRTNKFDIIDKCPICGCKTTIVKENESEILLCSNGNCKGKLLGKLVHFCSKNAMNIDGLSESTLEKLIAMRWINGFVDIYKLYAYKNEMQMLEGFGGKSVAKLLLSIQNSRNTDLAHFINALGIPGCGKSTSKDIATHCKGDVGAFLMHMDNGAAEFAKINGIGQTLVESMDTWYSTEGEELIRELIDYIAIETPNNSSNYNVITADLKGKTYVITGSLSHFANRDELKNLIESLGGKVVGSVSAKTTALINNDVTSSSSKNKKAKDLGVKIVTEQEFLNGIGY